jgi:hypothetical protein
VGWSLEGDGIAVGVDVRMEMGLACGEAGTGVLIGLGPGGRTVEVYQS